MAPEPCVLGMVRFWPFDAVQQPNGASKEVDEVQRESKPRSAWASSADLLMIEILHDLICISIHIYTYIYHTTRIPMHLVYEVYKVMQDFYHQQQCCRAQVPE